MSIQADGAIGHRDADRAVVDTAVQQLRDTGVSIVEGVLTRDEAAYALDRLWAASGESTRRGIPTHISKLDPNESNVRVFNLIDLDPVFAELIANPTVDAIAAGLLGVDYIVSNFSANIARPGSESMTVHSDLGAVMPSPWTRALSLNAIWCFSDVTPDNGATLHIPGSHVYETPADVPADPMSHMVPFTAPAGSVVLMEGRVWHTSGRNITADEDRALAFAYLTVPYLRPQWNFTRALRPEVQAAMSPLQRYRLGLDAQLNMSGEEVFGDLYGKR